MSKFTSIFTRALLALVMASSVGAAVAGPIYHVSVDTRAWSGGGYLDLTLSALAGAAPATATLTHFTGDFGSATLVQGNAGGDVGSAVTLGNGATFNELLQAVNFGGLFTFDVEFSVANPGSIGTNFGVALVNAALDDYAAGTGGDVVAIGLMPGAPETLVAAGGLATVNPVPEPASALVFGTGLLLLTQLRGRRGRRRNGA